MTQPPTSRMMCPKCGLEMFVGTENIMPHCPRCYVAPPLVSAAQEPATLPAARCTHPHDALTRRYDHTPGTAHTHDTVTAECGACGYVFWRARRDLLDFGRDAGREMTNIPVR